MSGVARLPKGSSGGQASAKTERRRTKTNQKLALRKESLGLSEAEWVKNQNAKLQCKNQKFHD
jgi:hypothetical protein